MCGRYQLSKAEHDFRKRFNVSVGDDLRPRYNIAPSQQVVAIRQNPEQPVRELSFMRWGLVPFWAKDAKIGYKMINARAETILEKPSFRTAFKKRRCLIPANGFYEWRREGKEKQPYHFGIADDSLFAFAGIWESWKSPENTIIESCSILTTTPNALLQDVHDRMPVILRSDDYDQYLDPAHQQPESLTDLLRPFDAALMRRYAVSTKVNSVKNDLPECAAPLALSAGARA